MGSQFFIMHQDNPLPKNYVIFGKVTKGLDVVDTIAEAPVQADGQTPDKPRKNLVCPNHGKIKIFPFTIFLFCTIIYLYPRCRSINR